PVLPVGLVMMPIMVMPRLIVPVSRILIVLMKRTISGHRPVNMLRQNDDARPFHMPYGRGLVMGFAVDRARPAGRYVEIVACHGCARSHDGGKHRASQQQSFHDDHLL